MKNYSQLEMIFMGKTKQFGNSIKLNMSQIHMTCILVCTHTHTHKTWSLIEVLHVKIHRIPGASLFNILVHVLKSTVWLEGYTVG